MSLSSHRRWTLESLVRETMRLGLHRDRCHALQLRLLQVLPDDPEVNTLVTERIEVERSKEITSPDPFRATNPLKADAPSGSLAVGRIKHSDEPYRIDPDFLTNNTLIVGRPGGGKTNLILWFLIQLIALGVCVVVFDRKRDYAALSALPGFRYWLFEDSYVNFIEPVPGEVPEHWFNILPQILAGEIIILLPSRTVFAEAELKLAKRMQSQTSGIWPTLKDIHEYVTELRYPAYTQSAKYRDNILNRTQGMLQVFGDHVCSRRRLNWSIYGNSSWAISLDNLPTDYQNIYISVAVAKLLRYRMLNNLRSGKLTHLFVFDEASTIFRKQHENQEGTYMLMDYLAKCREFGIGFLIATQTLSGLAESVIANTGFKYMIGGCGLGSDYEQFAKAIGLNFEQTQFSRQLTQPGTAVVKDPRYPHPFTIEVPLVAQ